MERKSSFNSSSCNWISSALHARNRRSSYISDLLKLWSFVKRKFLDSSRHDTRLRYSISVRVMQFGLETEKLTRVVQSRGSLLKNIRWERERERERERIHARSLFYEKCFAFFFSSIVSWRIIKKIKINCKRFWKYKKYVRNFYEQKNRKGKNRSIFFLYSWVLY